MAGLIDRLTTSIHGLFERLEEFPRALVTRNRLVVTVEVQDKASVESVSVTWSHPEPDNRSLHRRFLKYHQTEDGWTSMFFSRHWRFPERSGFKVVIKFRGNQQHVYEINEKDINLVSTLEQIRNLPPTPVTLEGSNQVVARVRSYILDVVGSSIPEGLLAHLGPRNIIGHALFLCDHTHKRYEVFGRLKDWALHSGEVAESTEVLTELRAKFPDIVGSLFGVDELRDFVGAVFGRIQTPETLEQTVQKFDSPQAQPLVEHIWKEFWAYVSSLVAAAKHKFLSNKEGFIYPPPPIHISPNGKSWENWGLSLRSTPGLIYSDNNAPKRSPTSIANLQEIIRKAKAKSQLPIRVFGSAHSWSPIAQTTGTLIDGRKLGWKADNPKNADVFDQATVEKYIDYKYLYVTPEDPLSGGFPTVTFPPGLATGTLERFIYYSAKDQAGNELKKQYSLGTTTYEDVFTMGGIVAAACHGTGRNYPTVSDWLVAVEFIDANGIIRRVDVKGNAFQRNTENDPWQEWKVEDVLGVSRQDLFKAVICNYGLFGIMWSLTIRIIPGFDTFFIAERIPWRDFLDNTEHSRKNLDLLQNQSSSLEFFYYPFGTNGLISWEKNPHVYMLRHLTATEENRQLLIDQGYTIVKKPDDYYLLRDLKTRVFSGIFFNIITSLLKGPKFISGFALPYVLAQMPNNLEYTVDPSKNLKEAINLPHWRANHSVNAVGAVENIRVLNIEWALPMTFNDPTGNGLTHALDVHSHLIKSIHAAADKREFPVTVVAEIRFFRGSGALLAPEYDPQFSFPDDPFVHPPEPYKGWAAPEIVTGVHNPWWLDFYKQMNEDVYDKIIKGEVPVRNHLAKQYASLPGQLARLRHEFDRVAPFPFTLFRNIRRKLDPENVFLVPLMYQFLETDATHYTAPRGYDISEDGKFPDNQK